MCNEELLEAAGGCVGQPARAPAPRPSTTRASHIWPSRARRRWRALRRARALGLQGPADLPHRRLLARPQPELRFVHLRPPPHRGGPVAQAPQPELVLAGSGAVGALLRHACSTWSPRASDRHPLRHVLRRPRGEMERLCAFAGLEPRPRACARTSATTRIGVGPRRRRRQRRAARPLRGAVPRGRRPPSRRAAVRRGPRAPPHPRRRRGPAPRRPASGRRSTGSRSARRSSAPSTAPRGGPPGRAPRHRRGAARPSPAARAGPPAATGEPGGRAPRTDPAARGSAAGGQGGGRPAPGGAPARDAGVGAAARRVDAAHRGDGDRRRRSHAHDGQPARGGDPPRATGRRSRSPPVGGRDGCGAAPRATCSGPARRRWPGPSAPSPPSPVPRPASSRRRPSRPSTGEVGCTAAVGAHPARRPRRWARSCASRPRSGPGASRPRRRVRCGAPSAPCERPAPTPRPPPASWPAACPIPPPTASAGRGAPPSRLASTGRSRFGIAPTRRHRSRSPRVPRPGTGARPTARWCAAAWTGAAPWLAVVAGPSAGGLRGAEPCRDAFPAAGRSAAGRRPVAHRPPRGPALRGHRHLVLPEGSRGWFRQQSGLRDHIVRSYRTVATMPAPGPVFDLDGRPDPKPGRCAAEVRRLAAGRRAARRPRLDLERAWASELPDTGDVHAAGGRAPALPRPQRRHRRGRPARTPRRGRSRRGTVSSSSISAAPAPPSGTRRSAPVADAASGGARADGSSSGPPPSADPAGPRPWRNGSAAAGAELPSAPSTRRTSRRRGPTTWSSLLEPRRAPAPRRAGGRRRAGRRGSRPRPSPARSSRPTAGSRPRAAPCSPTGPSALIAARSLDVRAPWHEYVRPVCWAPGCSAAAATAVGGGADPGGARGTGLVREWCARALGGGRQVCYQPMWSSCASTATAASRRRRCGLGAGSGCSTCARPARRARRRRVAAPAGATTTWRRAGDEPARAARRAHADAGVRPRQRLAGRRQHDAVPLRGRVAGHVPRREEPGVVEERHAERLRRRASRPTAGSAWAERVLRSSELRPGGHRVLGAGGPAAPVHPRALPATRVVVNSMDVHFLRTPARPSAAAPASTHHSARGRPGAEHLPRRRRRLAVSDKERDLLEDFLGNGRVYTLPLAEDVERSRMPLADRRGCCSSATSATSPTVRPSSTS